MVGLMRTIQIAEISNEGLEKKFDLTGVRNVPFKVRESSVGKIALYVGTNTAVVSER